MIPSSSRYIPPRTSNLFAWYSAFNPANNGVLPADNTALSACTDKSGNGNNLSQSTTGNQPVFKTALINGRPGISFNGTSQFFSGNLFNPVSTWSISFVVNNSVTTTQCAIYTGNSSANGFGFFYDTNRSIVHGGASIKTDSANPNAIEIITLGWNGNGSFLRVNGVDQTLTNTGGDWNPPTGNLFVGYSGGATEYLNGALGDIIIRSAYALQTVQYDEQYLSAMYGVSI